MKKLNFTLLMIFLVGMIIFSCSKSDPDNNGNAGGTGGGTNNPGGGTGNPGGGAGELKPKAGTFDSTFGTNGILFAEIGSSSTRPTDAVQLSDNKIFISAISSDNPDQLGFDFSMLKINANGTLDNTFSTDGKVRTDVSLTSTEDEAQCITVQPDGKIILAGRTNNPGVPSNGNRGIALVRYNATGTLDQSFGNNGTAFVVNPLLNNNTYTESYYIQDINMASDGKILVSGQCRTEGTGTQQKMYLFVSKFNSNGTLDNSFGSGGTVKILEGTRTSGINSFADPRSFKVHTILLNDGKMLSTSWFLNGTNGLQWDYTLVKQNSDGSLDNSFGNGGKVYIPIDKTYTYRTTQLAIQSDDKIIIASQKVVGGKQSFFVARYNSNGLPDNSFGNNGSVLIDIGTTSGDWASTVSIQPDNKILVSGASYDQTFSRSNLAVVRLLSNGSMDAGFGNNGKLESQFDPYYSWPIASFISSDNKLRVISISGQRTSVVSINL